MSKNLLNPEDKSYMLSRLEKLTPSTPHLWGRMNVNQMLRHVSDGIRMAFGEVKVSRTGNLMTRTFMRWAILGGVPAPKGKAKTFPEMDMVERGIDPPDFRAELNNLKGVVERISAGKNTLPESPTLGKFTPQNWARLNYVHMDHHLKQFGV